MISIKYSIYMHILFTEVFLCGLQEDFYIFRQKHKPGSLRERDFVQSAAGVQKSVLLPGKKDA